MTKTNTKMELEQFVANLMRNFFGFPTNGKFETFGESKARILEDNTIEFFIAEYKDIQIVESFSFSEFMEYLLKVQSEIEKRYEQLGAAHIGELYYGCSSSKSSGFEFFNDVLYHVLRFLSDKFSSTSEQNVREIVNDKIIEFLTNNPDERISDIDSLYEDCFEHLSDLESEYDVMLSDWEDSEYADMALDNCSSFIHLLLVFKELDVNVNLNSEFKKNENSSGATRIVTVELELPSGNKLVFKKGEGKLKKALYYNLLQIVSDELSVEKVLKNIKLETGKEDKSAYDDLFKDFTFIQELKQKIEKTFGEIRKDKVNDMNKDKRTGWLGNLKVGDNVFVRSDFSLKLGRVSKITPTGRITVFNSTFSHLGRAGSGYSVIRLEEATPEKISKYHQKLQKSKMIKLVKENFSKINFEKLDLGDIEELADILNTLVRESSGE